MSYWLLGSWEYFRFLLSIGKARFWWNDFFLCLMGSALSWLRPTHIVLRWYHYRVHHTLIAILLPKWMALLRVFLLSHVISTIWEIWEYGVYILMLSYSNDKFKSYFYEWLLRFTDTTNSSSNYFCWLVIWIWKVRQFGQLQVSTH